MRSTLSPSLTLERVGNNTPTWPVKVNGRSAHIKSGKLPNPLPKNNVGVTVLNRSAPIDKQPVPPISTSVPTETIASCLALTKNWYLPPP